MNGADIIKLRDALKAKRAPLETHWDELSRMFMPFRMQLTGGMPDIPGADEVWDSTGRMAAMILANGLASLVTPREEVWFEYAPPRALRQDHDAVAFYRRASEDAREALEGSNFYEEIQESYIDSPVFGTAALYLGDLDERNRLYFRHQPVGTFFIGEDAQGRVNHFVRELELTAEQAAMEFGNDKLPAEVSSKLGTPEGGTEPHLFVHCVKPGDKGADKPWESVSVHENSKTIVASAQYAEFPFAVHRYRRFGRCVYGFGPGTIALSDARQLQFLEQLADTATEKSVFPPVVAPSSLEGEIGQGALEITYVDPTDPNSAAMLREWATSARYDVCMDRITSKQNQLKELFHVSLFQIFAQRQDRQPLTATEASLVAGEKMTQFSPVFGRLVSEMLDPVLLRVFGVLMRAGRFGTPPASVARVIGKSTSVAAPSVLYKNRIMLAMQQRENQNLVDFMTLAQPIMAVYPEAMDALKLPTVVRDVARNNGLKEDWLRTPEELEQIAAARAEAQQAAVTMDMAEKAASAGQKLSQIPAEMRQGAAGMF